MNQKLTSLEKIRAQYSNKPSISCPRCGHGVTVEKTDYFVTQICENCFEHCKVIPHDPCCSEPSYHPVKYPIANGGFQVRQQCKSCGNIKAQAIGGFSQEERLKLPLADVAKRDQYQQALNEAWGMMHQARSNGKLAKINDLKDDWFKRYSIYLHSPEWRAKRELVLRRDNYKCQCCLTALATQVHHKSYEFVDLKGSEPCFDLVAVCKPCHDKIEGMKANNRLKNN